MLSLGLGLEAIIESEFKITSRKRGTLPKYSQIGHELARFVPLVATLPFLDGV